MRRKKKEETFPCISERKLPFQDGMIGVGNIDMQRKVKQRQTVTHMKQKPSNNILMPPSKVCHSAAVHNERKTQMELELCNV